MENEQLLKKRLAELCSRATSRAAYTHSDFLSLSEQSFVPADALRFSHCTLFGGYDAAERRVAIFGNEQICGYAAAPPISCVKISAKSAGAKSEAAPSSKIDLGLGGTLSHRDILGALMSLGIKREALGDIVLQENLAYLFCLESIAPYICENLVKSKHAPLFCEVCNLPEFLLEAPPLSDINIASERLDALVAAVYKLSRSDAQKLFAQKLVFADGREVESSSFVPNAKTMISVRGKGRFFYEGIARETRKGRLCANVRIY